MKRFAIRAGGNFAELLAGREPHFDIVGFCGREAHVPGTQQHRAIVQTKFLQNSFRVANQRFVLLIAFFGMSELEEFDFLELMLAQNTPGIFSRGASFGTETGRPRRHIDRQFFFGHSFVAI